ncbi:MAG TPA: hypothetical protein VG756_18500 [Pseudonocardiaceae bacterium]|nr:hypothetical protein [Pseudonocardiaceae bacterium]
MRRDSERDVLARLRAKRHPFRHPADYVVVVLLVVASLVTWFVLYQRSDIHNTTLVTGPANVTVPSAPTTFPPSLAEVWEEPSAATPAPVVAGPTVVTGDGGTVTGRDPLTGDQRWRYTRDLPLCTVSTAWSKAIAVYHRSNCNEVTELDQATGARGAQRNGDAPLGTRLVSDGIYLTATGTDLLDTWRSDLVQTDEYGAVPDFVNPNVQPRVGCTYGSVAASPGLVGVLERCPGDPGDRLSVFRSAPKSSDTPDVVFSSLVGDHGARLIAMNDEYTAVVVPGPTRVAVFNTQNGNQVASYPVDLPASDLQGNPPGLVVPTSQGTGAVYWYTGSSTIALSSLDFHPQWTVEGTLGAGTVFAGRYLVPVPNAIDVLDEATGAKVGQAGVNRHGYTGTVAMATLGPMVFEQRGKILAALR